MVINKPKILIVDDEVYLWDSFKEFLGSKGILQVRITYGVDEALLTINEFIPDILITEIRLDNTGLKLVQEAKKINPLTKVIYISSYNQILENLAEIKKLCIWDWIKRPFGDIQLYGYILAAIGKFEEASQVLKA